MAITVRGLAACAAVLVGCRAPASNLPATEVLRFGVSHMGDSTSFVVRSDRTATYEETGGPQGAVKVETTVTEEELAALAKLLEDKGFCSLVSRRRTGVPDEARPSVEVRLGNIDCRVQMWDNEFHDDEDAKTALAAIEALGANLRKRAAPPEPAKDAAMKPVIEEVGPFVAGVHGMALHDDGRLFFSDSFGKRDAERRVYVLDPPYTGDAKATALGGKTPAGLAWIDGALYLCDAKAGTVVAHDAQLSPFATWKVAGPWSIVKHPSGKPLVVTNDGRVVALEAAGAVRELFTGLLAPFALAVNPDGEVWITEQGAKQGDPGRVTLRKLDGTVAREITYAWANPEGVAFGADGALWVAETERGELVRVAPSGEAVAFDTSLKLPVVIAPSKNGDFFLSTGGPTPKLVRVKFGAGAP